ncbi:MAG: GDP-L-fucose synthase [Ignavibacteria bacterium]|nr:GDP-L-fucose synthase [Ignavibacteria bacterium]
MKSDNNFKIFVAGAKGLVGSAITKKLLEKGYTNLLTPSRKELDLRRQKETEEFFETTKPDYVFLAAAKVGGILANNTYRADFIYDNILIASNVIFSSYKYEVKKLVNLGSSCIYPKYAPQPLKEEYLLTGTLEPTNEPYAIAKIAAIKMCQAFNYQYGTNFISLMPTNLFGENDNFNLETSHVLPALIRKFILAKALSEENFDLIMQDFKSKPIGFGIDSKIHSLTKENIIQTLGSLGIFRNKVILWGQGKAMREFLYVDDLADACIYFIENYDAKDLEPFINIGTGEDISIKNLAELIKKIVGFEGEIGWNPQKPEGTPRKLLDVSRAIKLGWNPKTTLKEGIERVVKNYYNSLNNAIT